MPNANVCIISSSIARKTASEFPEVVRLTSSLSRPGVIYFPKRMGAPAPQPNITPTVPAPEKLNPQRWGTVAQLGSLFVSLLSLVLVVHWHHSESAKQSSNSDIKNLVHDQLSPFDEKIGRRFDSIETRLDDLSTRLGRAEGQLSRINGRVSTQGDKQAQLLAANAILNPARILEVIRAEIEVARVTGPKVSPANLAEYKEALKAVPDTADRYWSTVAQVINYQSYVNQLEGIAPDPRKVSRPCGGLTDNGHSGDNVYVGPMVIRGCILDLDTTHNLIQGATIVNSLVRYHGGPVAIQAVTFVNCFFKVDIVAKPSRPDFLLALLDSNQSRVRLSGHS